MTPTPPPASTTLKILTHSSQSPTLLPPTPILNIAALIDLHACPGYNSSRSGSLLSHHHARSSSSSAPLAESSNLLQDKFLVLLAAAVDLRSLLLVWFNSSSFPFHLTMLLLATSKATMLPDEPSYSCSSPSTCASLYNQASTPNKDRYSKYSSMLVIWLPETVRRTESILACVC